MEQHHSCLVSLVRVVGAFGDVDSCLHNLGSWLIDRPCGLTAGGVSKGGWASINGGAVFIKPSLQSFGSLVTKLLFNYLTVALPSCILLLRC